MFIRLSVIALCLASPALADTLATAEQIRAAISGNTVQGSMTISGAYTEFYAADGAIRAKDYLGSWDIEEDQMCFDYGEDDDACFSLRLAGDQVTWVTELGDEGTGTILPGNPNGF